MKDKIVHCLHLETKWKLSSQAVQTQEFGNSASQNSTSVLIGSSFISHFLGIICKLLYSRTMPIGFVALFTISWSVHQYME